MNRTYCVEIRRNYDNGNGSTNYNILYYMLKLIVN